MNEETKQVMSKVASYIGETQPLLDKQAEMRSKFLKRAHQSAGVLANKGLIAHDKVQAFVDKVAADESGVEVWNLVEKLADALPTDSLGEGIREKFASSGKELDAFEKLALYGDARAETRESGMLD
jgi:hypothetical protein